MNELFEVNEIEVKCRKPGEYEKFIKNKEIEIDDVTLVGGTAAIELAYEMQIASLYNKSKWKQLEELIEETEGRIVIYHNWMDEFKKLRQMCKDIKRPFAAVNQITRDVDRYMNCENSITAVRYEPGQRGYAFDKAGLIVYFGLPLSAKMFDEIQRKYKGHEKVYFLTNNTIDYEILESLKKGEDYDRNEQ